MTSASTPALSHPPADLIAGSWITPDGPALLSRNPAHPDRTVWQGTTSVSHVDRAVAAARAALPAWSAFPFEKRVAVLRRYQQIAQEHAEAMGELICDETGKALWEAAGESKALASKVDITLDESDHGGLRRVTEFGFDLSETKRATCHFRPHGVMAVLGPFNFPAHLPNGHIVPALLTGNTIVFKPSDKTPAVGQLLAQLFHQALEDEGAPAGVINLIQGGADVASALSDHNDLDGILFTGSWPVGRKILEANLDRPGRIVALELGGNNPAVIMPDADLKQAVTECVRGAFNTAGQRCTCTRRVILHESIAERALEAIAHATRAIRTGDPRDEGVLFGPVISEQSRDAVLAFQDDLRAAGADIIVEATNPNRDGWHVTPGLARVDRFTGSTEGPGRDAGCDIEVFGPLLRVSTATDLDDAIEQANATRFGLAAAIFTHDAHASQRFVRECRAGCVNLNCSTAGASGKLPFGGLGHSGNHRPAGAFSLDYTAHPVASMAECSNATSTFPGMTVDDAWFA